VEVDGQQGGLPVVTVQHCGLGLQEGKQFEDGPGEEAETLQVIGVVPLRGAVKVVAVEVAVVFHEKDREPGRIRQAEEAGLFRPRPDPDLELGGKRLDREPLFPGFPVEGENNSDFLL
jgi:hypothetical protein